jgi:hypothetical protein
MASATRAYLWTPLEAVSLDIGPLRAREQARLTQQRRSQGVVIRSMILRTQQLLIVLDGLIDDVQQLPMHDGPAAAQHAERLEHWAAMYRRRWPAWIYTRVAAHVRYRLLPHAVCPEWDEVHRCLVPPRPAHLARAAVLRARGRLVLVASTDLTSNVREGEVADAGPTAS